MIYINDLIKFLRKEKSPACTDEYNQKYDDAIKVLRMWIRLRTLTKNKDVGVPHWMMRIDAMVETLEEEFFPSKMTQGYKIKIEGKSMADICSIADCIGKVWGVKEVVMHDKDCQNILF